MIDHNSTKISGMHRTSRSDSSQCPGSDSSVRKERKNLSGLDESIRDLLNADMSELGQGVRKANITISEIQVADRALLSIGDKLLKMKEYARSSADKDCGSLDRRVIEEAYQKVALEITEIASATECFETGSVCDDVRRATAAELGLGSDADPKSAGFTVSTQEAAIRAMDGVTDAIAKKDAMRLRLDNLKKSLESTISSLVVKAQNIQAAEHGCPTSTLPMRWWYLSSSRY